MSLPKTYVKDFHNESSVKKMKYNPLGKTGLIVSKISLGGGTFSPIYGTIDEQESLKTIEKAIRNGINYIDTAPWYGQGKSEEIIGKALKNIPRNAYYIGTKVGRYELNLEEQFDFSAKKTRESVEKSLQLLNLNYVDVIQIHDVEFAPSLDIVIQETLPMLEKLKEEGLVKHIGLTGYPLNILKKAILQAPGKFEVVLTYTRYSLIDDSLKEYLSFFEEQNIGIICASGHSMGLLTNSGPQSWHAAHQDTKDLCRKAGQICKDNKIELGKLAMDHVLQLTCISTFLMGVQTEKLLDMNLNVYYDGLTEHERNILKDLNERIFCNIKNKHWEGVELKNYWDYMNKIKK